MTTWEWVSLGLIAVGLVPGLWFCISWGVRVRPQFNAATVDAGGWVYGLVAIYLFAIYEIVSGDLSPPGNAVQAAARIGLGLLLDGLIISRSVRWWQFARSYTHPHQHDQRRT